MDVWQGESARPLTCEHEGNSETRCFRHIGRQNPMIPISDENPTLHTPIMTWLILGAMFAVWLVVQGAGMDPETLGRTVCNLGLVPGELTHQAPLNQAVPIGPGLACV